MPIYEYLCVACGQRTETLQRVDDPPPPGCPHCGGELKRLLSAPAFQFKGSGWYVSDYAAKSGASKSRDEGASADKPADKPAETGKTASAPDAKPGATSSAGKSEP